MENVFFLSLGIVIGLFVYAQMFLPIIYGLPKSIWLYAKHRVKFMAVISQLITPIIWFVLFFALGFALDEYYPNVVVLITTNTALNVGSWISVAMLLLNMFSARGREDMGDDFNNSIAKYKIPTQNEKEIDAVLDYYDSH